MPKKKIVVFVHGYSVRSTDTYGKLPERLKSEARAGGIELDVVDVWLGKYVSFNDEVRLGDLARAFEAALRREVGPALARGARFACVTHSTGGPLVREWWQRFYLDRKRGAECPMSHLVMLAPANFGSALAQLGKGRLSRIKAWFQGVEPGQSVLDWLELGSPESWALNEAWIRESPRVVKAADTFVFGLMGQSIDHKLYDHVNSYTGELGSDGVVRVSAANLNAAYVKLAQRAPVADPASKRGGFKAPALERVETKEAAPTAFAILPGLSHSGGDMGILRSVRDDGRRHPTVDALLECIKVETGAGYAALRAAFDARSLQVQQEERVEVDERFLLPDTVRIVDPMAMVIFRIQDDSGRAIGDLDLVLTAGEDGNPNHLPQGFFGDRQKNRRHAGTLTYFVNWGVMRGEGVVRPDTQKVLREPGHGARTLGFRIAPRPEEGFVHYLPAELRASVETLDAVVRRNQTTLVDVVLRRVVRRGTFELTQDTSPKDFTKQEKGEPIET